MAPTSWNLDLCAYAIRLVTSGRLPLAASLGPFVSSPDLCRPPDFTLTFGARSVRPTEPPPEPDLVVETVGDEIRFRRHVAVMTAALDLRTFAAPLPDEDELTGQPWLMLALWAHLSRYGGLFLHGSALLIDGRLVLAVGPPDIGKSTIARLVDESGQYALGDENCFARLRGDAMYGYGSPWPGIVREAPATGGPLAAVLLLRQSAQPAARPLAPAAALRRLIPVTRFLTALSDTVPSVLAELGELVARVPVFDFGFAPEPRVVDDIRRLL